MARGRIVAAAAAQLQDPLRRSSNALIIGTGLTSGLGLVFWMLAARWVPPDAVGIGVALVSAMTFVATLSTLGLRNGLIRFLPSAGPTARRLVAASYGLCAVVAAAGATVFVLGQPWWAEKLGLLQENSWAGPVFVAATSLWVVFILQNDVFVGLGRSVWVPLTNGFASAAKIALLPALAFSAGWAIFAASVLPAIVVVAVGGVVILRASAGAASTAPQGSRPVPLPHLVRFAATDHFSALLWIATENLLTLVVLHRAGAEASAYYFMSFMVGYPLYLITINIGSALVAAAARTPDRLDELARRALKHAIQIVAPLAVTGCLAAPWVLGLLGAAYAQNGTLLLQLIIVSAIPQTLVGVALSSARVRHDYRLILVVYTVLAIGVFGVSWFTVGTWGLTGVGAAWVGVQTLVAAGLLLTGRSGLSRTGPPRVPVAVEGIALVPAHVPPPGQTP